MFKKLSALLLSLIALAALSACGGPATASPSAEPQVSETPKLRVSVSFDAMQEFVQAVGGELVDISTIIPAGAEPHDFEPKAQDLAALSEANVFVYSGLGMESWAEDAIAAANNANLVTVDASEGADLIKRSADDADEHEDEDEGEEAHGHGEYDPHLWLSLKGAQTQVRNIKDALAQADPANKATYEANADAFIAELQKLFDNYSEKLGATSRKEFVTGHAAFGYLCRDFGLTQNSVRDIYADGEPSAQQLAELVEYCREHQVTTVFSESMASPEVSQTLANEVGAKVETIYTLESAEDGKSYLERMEDNLSKIYDSLSK